MPYSTGSIVSATPVAAISQKIKDLVGGSGVANWSFVENIPAGTGTGQSGSASYSIDVFKCAGTGTNANSTATDFYVALRIPVPDVAGNNPVLNVFEDYEGGVNKRFKRPVATGSTAAPTGAGYWRSDTYAAAASVTGVRDLAFGVIVNTTGFTHYLSLTNNTLVLGLIVGTSGGGFWVSTGDTFVAPALATDAFIMAGQGATNSLWVSREPGVTDATISKWTYTLSAWTPPIGSNNSATDVDFFQQGKIVSARMLVSHGSSSNGHLIGRYRGLVNANILKFLVGGTINLGDTIVINGVTYAVVDTGSGSVTMNTAMFGSSGNVTVAPAV